MIDSRELMIGNYVDWNDGIDRPNEVFPVIVWGIELVSLENLNHKYVLRVDNGEFEWGRGQAGICVLEELEFIRPIHITEQWLRDFGFEFNIMPLLNSYSLNLQFTYATSEIISLSRNNDALGLWYLTLRQGDEIEKEKMHNNDVCILSNKLKYVHQLQNWYFQLTGEELTLNKEKVK